MKAHTCCFFGHRRIEITPDLQRKLYDVIEALIVADGICTFLFGSKSQFNDLCLETVSRLKEKHPYIRRIYVRAEFPVINDSYRSYLLQRYEDTYYPERMVRAGRSAYVERNREMIDKSNICVVYYRTDYLPMRQKNSLRDQVDHQPKSGTKLAHDYAIRKGLKILNLAAEQPPVLE